jgi:hypothetical protein
VLIEAARKHVGNSKTPEGPNPPMQPTGSAGG